MKHFFILTLTVLGLAILPSAFAVTERAFSLEIGPHIGGVVPTISAQIGPVNPNEDWGILVPENMSVQPMTEAVADTMLALAPGIYICYGKQVNGRLYSLSNCTLK